MKHGEGAFPAVNGSFTAQEAALVRELSTPEQVQAWLRTLQYNTEDDGETLRSFRRVVADGVAHCIEGALAVACILEQHGMPPTLLDLESKDELHHDVALFRRHGKWGAVGMSRDPGLHGRKPVYTSLYHLALSYYEPYIDATGRLVRWGVADLRDCPFDWRFGERNLFRIDKWLEAHPHKPIATSDERYRKLQGRYVRWAAANPGQRPTFYRNRNHWL